MILNDDRRTKVALCHQFVTINNSYQLVHAEGTVFAILKERGHGMGLQRSDGDVYLFCVE